MELSLRLWMLIIGGLLVVGVIVHGLWWRSRQERLRIKIDRSIIPDEVDPFADVRGELPNGGARVVGSQAQMDFGEAVFAEDRSAASLDDTDVPVLVHPVGEETGAVRSDAQAPAAAMTNRDTAAANRSRASADLQASDQNPSGAAPTPRSQRQAKSEEPDVIIAVNVIARSEHGFLVHDLIDIATDQGLEYGEMNIFHRFLNGNIEFSMANALEPGTFDLGTADQVYTPGLSLFMRLPGPIQPNDAFDELLAVAERLGRDLDGSLKDEQLSTLTRQGIEQLRERIFHYERKRMTRRA